MLSATVAIKIAISKIKYSFKFLFFSFCIISSIIERAIRLATALIEKFKNDCQHSVELPVESRSENNCIIAENIIATMLEISKVYAEPFPLWKNITITQKTNNV